MSQKVIRWGILLLFILPVMFGAFGSQFNKGFQVLTTLSCYGILILAYFYDKVDIDRKS